GGAFMTRSPSSIVGDARIGRLARSLDVAGRCGAIADLATARAIREDLVDPAREGRQGRIANTLATRAIVCHSLPANADDLLLTVNRYEDRTARVAVALSSRSCAGDEARRVMFDRVTPTCPSDARSAMR